MVGFVKKHTHTSLCIQDTLSIYMYFILAWYAFFDIIHPRCV